MENQIPLREVRRQMIERWQQSGLSQIAFCRQENISFHGFYYWKKRFCKEKKPPAGKFLKLRAPAASSTGNIFAEVILTNGVRIHLHREVPLQALKQLSE